MENTVLFKQPPPKIGGALPDAKVIRLLYQIHVDFLVCSCFALEIMQCNCFGFFAKFLQEFFEYLEKARAVELENLARRYRAVGPLLTKMEGLVVHTNTGRSTKLQPYYAYWENAVYEALTKVLTYRNLVKQLSLATEGVAKVAHPRLINSSHVTSCDVFLIWSLWFKVKLRHTFV